MLLFFLLANVILAVLIRYEAGGHTLSRERENAILSVLAQNNISVYYHIPRNFAPMRPLQVAAYYYDFDRLQEIFFPYYADDISHTSDTNRDVFAWEDYRLVISNGYISFSKARGPEGTPDRYAAKALTQAFIREHYPDFRLDAHSTRQARRGGLRIFYRQVYQNNLIHTNFVEFLVTGDGHNLMIEEIDIQYGVPIGFAYMPRELVGTDEALLALVQSPQMQNVEDVTISHMDIVYFQVMSGLIETYTPIYAEPFYRVFIKGQEEPFLINAYTNRIQ